MISHMLGTVGIKLSGVDEGRWEMVLSQKKFGPVTLKIVQKFKSYVLQPCQKRTMDSFDPT